MPVLEKKEFLSKVAIKENSNLRIAGVQNGKFILMADLDGVTYICSKNEKFMEFKKIEGILRIVQFDTSKKRIQLEIENWVGS